MPRASGLAPIPGTSFRIDQLVEAARATISPDVRQRAPRYGRIGACVACSQPIHAHFDAAGGFLGCAAVTEDTVFVLVPISDGDIRRPASPSRMREFRRARYIPVIRKGSVDDLNLTDRQRNVLQHVIDAGKRGILNREVEQLSGLTHSSVSNALHWLRRCGLIDARDADAENDGG